VVSCSEELFLLDSAAPVVPMQSIAWKDSYSRVECGVKLC